MSVSFLSKAQLLEYSFLCDSLKEKGEIESFLAYVFSQNQDLASMKNLFFGFKNRRRAIFLPFVDDWFRIRSCFWRARARSLRCALEITDHSLDVAKKRQGLFLASKEQYIDLLFSASDQIPQTFSVCQKSLAP